MPSRPSPAHALPVLLLLAGTSLACAATPPRLSSTGRVEAREQPAHAGSSFALAPGDTVALAGDSRRVTFERVVEDSRCPREVVCVWAGRAVVELTVADSEGRHESVQRVVGEAAPPVAGLALAALSLDPYPRAHVATTPADYRLHLEVARATTSPSAGEHR